MKANELQQLIRRMVREEVASEVSKAMGKVLVEMVKEIKKPTTTSVLAEEVEELAVPILKTNNSRLNSALNETARNFKPLPRTEEAGSSLVELMEGGFEKIGKHEKVEAGQPKTKMEFLKQMVNESATPPAQSVLDAGAPVPDSLKKIFKKDFRAILAKSKEKNSGGYFNPGAVLSGVGESPS